MAERRKRKRHKNSRLGCSNCKQKRIKCGEELDSCYNCVERNLVCSFLSLSEAEKARFRAIKKANNEDEDADGSWDSEIADLIRKGAFFQVEKYNVDGNMMVRTAQRQSRVYDESSMTGTLDFGPSYRSFSSNAASLNSTAPRHQRLSASASSTSSSLQTSPLQTSPEEEVVGALAGAEKVVQTFAINDISRNLIFYEALMSTDLFTLCGEDDLLYSSYRRGITNWFQTLIDYATQSMISFHHDMSLSGSIIAAKLTNRRNSRENVKTIGFIKKFILSHKVDGLKLAQSTIDLLNSPQNIPDMEYLTSVHKLVSYSTVNVASSVISDHTFTTFLAFAGGLMSITLLKQILTRFGSILVKSEMKGLDPHYPVRFLRRTFPFIHGYYLDSIKSVYIPCHGFSLLHEVRQDLSLFLSKVPLQSKAKSSLTTLLNFLSDPYFNLPQYQTTVNSKLVMEHDPQTAFRLFSGLTCLYPSMAVNVFYTYNRMSIDDKFACLYWMVVASLLDSSFPESQYVFTCKFSGLVRFSGIDMRFEENLQENLEDLKSSNPQLSDYLFRRSIYLIRTLSYASYRWRIWNKNLQVLNPYPDSPIFRKNRFKARKPEFILEKPVLGLKRGFVEQCHYPVNDPNYVEDNSLEGLASPMHPKYLKFVDDGFDINLNVDENYDEVQHVLDTQFNGCFDVDTFPIEYLRLSEWGLLKNLDYRPNLQNVKTNMKGLDDTLFDSYEKVLNDHNTDWHEIQNYYNERAKELEGE